MGLTNDNDEARRVVEQCYQRHKTTLNPIIDWMNAEVWEFIHAERAEYCGMYDCGFSRLGCIGGPMAGIHEKEREFLRWPKYRDMYLRTFKKMLDLRERDNLLTTAWTGAEDVFRWWIGYDDLPGQIDLLEDNAT